MQANLEDMLYNQLSRGRSSTGSRPRIEDKLGMFENGGDDEGEEEEEEEDEEEEEEEEEQERNSIVSDRDNTLVDNPDDSSRQEWEETDVSQCLYL